MSQKQTIASDLNIRTHHRAKYQIIYLLFLFFMFVVVFTTEAKAFSGGTGTVADPYIIASVEDIKGITNDGDVYFVQNVDIDLGGEVWSPIELNGTYDGGGHKITGLTDVLFSSIGAEGIVKNLTVDAHIISTSRTGIIAADNDGSVINCDTSGTIEVTRDYNHTYVGGVVGSNGSTGKVLSCSSSANITVTTTGSYTYVGGIVGGNSKDGHGTGIVKSCSSSATITVTSSERSINAGGVVGNNMGDVMNCSNSGTITAGNGTSNYVYVGGVVGGGNDGSSVISCSNTGAITADGTNQSHAGGIIGNNDGTVEYSVNSGDVKVICASFHYGGGVVGSNSGTVAYSSNSGTIESYGDGKGYIGGVAGDNDDTLSNCTNTGEATATGENVYVGGITGGNAQFNTTVTNCGWLGGDGMPDQGVGYAFGGNTSALDTSPFTSDEVQNIPAEITAKIAADSITEGAEADITFSLKNPDSNDLNFSDYANIAEPKVEGDAVTAAISENKITITGQSVGTAEITAKANITKWYDFSKKQTIDLVSPIEYVCSFIVTVVPFVNVESVTLTPSELSLTTAETAQLKAAVSPEDASDQTLTWESSAPDVATVDENGNIRPVSIGETTITAAAGECTASCKVSVTEEFVKTVAVSHDITEDTLYAGEEYTITAEVAPDYATYKGVEWSVNDPSKAVSVVASDDKTLTLKAEAEGEIVVTALSVGHTDTSNNKACDTARLYVRYPNVSSVTVKPNDATITGGVGGTAELTAQVMPANAQYGKIEWTSADESVANVAASGDKGGSAVVTAVGAGTAVVTATAGGVSGNCKVTVEPVPATAVTIKGGETIEIKEGGSYTLTYTLEPENSTDKAKWSSSDTSVAEIDENGTIRAIATGTATITATVGDGLTATKTIKVTQATTPPSHSGGGCSAGWGALALLALVPFAFRRRG